MNPVEASTVPNLDLPCTAITASTSGNSFGQRRTRRAMASSAREALSLGVVSEVLPANQLLTRAWALAEDWVRKPVQTLRYTRIARTHPIKRRMQDELGYGLALEGLGITAGS